MSQKNAILAAVLLLSGFVGCATTKIHAPSMEVKDVTPQRTERKDEVIENFESRRNEAQYGAALEAWERGDETQCEQNLQTILSRAPKHQQARLLLADLYAATGREAAARNELNVVLREAPENAEAHHAMGMLLESIGQQQTAIRHYERAANLAPQNDLFRLTLDSCRLSDSPTPPTSASPR